MHIQPYSLNVTITLLSFSFNRRSKLLCRTPGQSSPSRSNLSGRLRLLDDGGPGEMQISARLSGTGSVFYPSQSGSSFLVSSASRAGQMMNPQLRYPKPMRRRPCTSPACSIAAHSLRQSHDQNDSKERDRLIEQKLDRKHSEIISNLMVAI